MRTVGIHTLGCKVNTYESEVLMNKFKNNAFELLEERGFVFQTTHLEETKKLLKKRRKDYGNDKNCRFSKP